MEPRTPFLSNRTYSPNKAEINCAMTVAHAAPLRLNAGKPKFPKISTNPHAIFTYSL